MAKRPPEGGTPTAQNSRLWRWCPGFSRSPRPSRGHNYNCCPCTGLTRPGWLLCHPREKVVAERERRASAWRETPANGTTGCHPTSPARWGLARGHRVREANSCAPGSGFRADAGWFLRRDRRRRNSSPKPPQVFQVLVICSFESSFSPSTDGGNRTGGTARLPHGS